MKIKKHTFLVLFVAAFFSANAQTVTYNPGKVHSLTLNFSDSGYDGIEFTNITNIKQTMNWVLLSVNTLSDCSFSMCQSGQCLIGLPSAGSFPSLLPSQIGWLKLHSYSGTTAGTNIIKYRVDDGNNQIDTLTFIINVANLTGINTSENPNRQLIQLLSNTTTDYIDVKINESVTSASTLSIYNVTGSLLHRQTANDGENNISVSSLPSGFYFVTYQNSKASVTKRFVKLN